MNCMTKFIEKIREIYQFLDFATILVVIFKEILVIILGTILKNGGRFLKNVGHFEAFSAKFRFWT